MSNKLVVTPNCVLLSKLNPHIPRIWLPDLHSTRRSVCSTEFMVACSKPGLSREYLFSLFTSSAFESALKTHSHALSKLGDAMQAIITAYRLTPEANQVSPGWSTLSR